MKLSQLIAFSSLLIILMFTFQSCEKDPPTVETKSVIESEITTNTAIVRGNVTDNGGDEVTERGICYGTSLNPTEEEEASAGGNGDFEVSLTGLTPDTDYFVRAYAVNSVGTSYGDNESFRTKKENTPPTVETEPVDDYDITTTTAIVQGTVTDNGGDVVKERGICYGTAINPTEEEEASEGGNGDFEVTLTGLTPDTKYFVRAYAVNDEGTSYGYNETFRTKIEIILPEVQTVSVDEITSSSAIVQGNILNDGGAAVTARGVCWSSSQDPTIADNYATNGSGTGSFTSSISNLASKTTYYVRAYATNSEGTAYGNELSFTTGADEPTVTVVASIDGYQVTFTATVTDADSYQWDFGDGATSTELSPTHTYGQSGNYTATITVTGDGGVASASTSVTISASELEMLTGGPAMANGKAWKMSPTSSEGDGIFKCTPDFEFEYPVPDGIFGVIGIPTEYEDEFIFHHDMSYTHDVKNDSVMAVILYCILNQIEFRQTTDPYTVLAPWAPVASTFTYTEDTDLTLTCVDPDDDEVVSELTWEDVNVLEIAGTEFFGVLDFTREYMILDISVDKLQVGTFLSTSEGSHMNVPRNMIVLTYIPAE